VPDNAFDWQPRTRVISGRGSLSRLGSIAEQIGARKALLVTDSGIVAAGHAERAFDSIERAGIPVTLYDKTRENPTTADVAQCVEAARAANVDLIVGLGGGSSMDTAKGCNLLLTNGGQVKDYWGVGKAKRPLLPLIAVPTTAGTGSECQSAALIADEHTHQKMACLDPKIAARASILDPELTLSQPARVTACTGFDAIAHAIETGVTTKRTPLSTVFSKEAFRLCYVALPRVLRKPQDTYSREDMQLGAAFAGMAIENSMLGAAHSAANPLTAHYNIVHGQAVGIVLTAVIRFNAAAPIARAGYDDLARVCSLADTDSLIIALDNVLKLAGLAAPLRSFGVKEEDIPGLAKEASRQWTATFNPRPIAAADFQKIYESLL
jgi:alcohol dehydrogenase